LIGRSFILVILLMVLWTGLQLPDRNLHIIFCDVGQGDSSLIVLGSFQMLIDSGPPNGKAVACLGRHMPFWDKTLEVVISTHNQKDHVGGLSEVKRHYLVEREHGVDLLLKDIIRYDSLRFDVLWPSVEVVASAPKDLNEIAVTGKLSYGEFTALFTADIGAKEELAIVNMGVLGKVDVLKVAHHGSKFSSDEKFLEVIRPDEAVVSVGKNNGYGHPTAEVLMRFDTLKSRVWRTDQNGEMEVVTNGMKYWIETEK